MTRTRRLIEARRAKKRMDVILYSAAIVSVMSAMLAGIYVLSLTH